MELIRLENITDRWESITMTPGSTGFPQALLILRMNSIKQIKPLCYHPPADSEAKKLCFVSKASTCYVHCEDETW